MRINLIDDQICDPLPYFDRVRAAAGLPYEGGYVTMMHTPDPMRHPLTSAGNDPWGMWLFDRIPEKRLTLAEASGSEG